MSKNKRIFWWGLIAFGLSLSTIHCGWNRPPRLWQCQCRVSCVEDPALTRNTTQQACGYTHREVQRHAAYLTQRSGISGCRRVTSTCNNCLISRKHYCRTRVSTVPLDDIDDDYGWEPDDYVTVTDEFVDPESPQYQDDQGHYEDPDPGNPDPGDPGDPGGSDSPDSPDDP